MFVIAKIVKLLLQIVLGTILGYLYVRLADFVFYRLWNR